MDETGEVFSEKLKAFTLELPDCKDKPMEFPKTQIEYWLYNLVNMETMTTALPFQAQQPIFGKVGGISELVHMSEEERLKYNVSLDAYRTNLCVMKNEHAEGIEEGIAIGERYSQLATASAMKADGWSVDKIQKYTGLTPEEIAEL